MLFIDDHSMKGFCSESCIEDFYLPIVKHFEKEFSGLLESHGLKETPSELKIDHDLINTVFKSPDEIYRFSNHFGESFYHFFKKFGLETVVVVASVFRHEPSFIFGATVCASGVFLNEYRQGEMLSVSEWTKKRIPPGQTKNIDDNRDTPEDKIEISEDDAQFIQLLESKKSKLLAQVLLKRKESDIGIEAFGDYESCFQETLEHPDEVFEHKDNEGDTFFNYIKNYNLGKRKEDNFFYIVSCLKKQTNQSTETMVYPVLGMPTNDMEMVLEFSLGKQLSGPLKN